MVEGNEQGKKARQYFIACEEKAKQLSKPLTQLEILSGALQVIMEHDKRLDSIESRLNGIASASLNSQTDTFNTISGYSKIEGLSMNLPIAQRLGILATKLCNERGIITGKIPNSNFGTVKTYPLNILKEVFINYEL